MHSPIHGYVADLLAGLRVGTGRRGRISAEVSDHLAELVAEECRRGGSPEAAAERAVARFGDPKVLAAEFNEDAARYSLNQAAWALVACAAVAFGAAGLALHVAVPARPWPSGLVFYAVPELLVQVAIVCGLNGLFLAVVAPWLRGVPLAGRPAALAARSLVTAGIALVPVAVVAAGNLGASVPFAERLPLAVVAVGVPVAACRGVRAAMRASWLGSARDGENTLDVIAAVCQVLACRWPAAGRAYRFAGTAWRAAYDWAPWLMRWLDLRGHPWRAAATVSLAAGLAGKAPDLLAGDPDLIGAAIESIAVFICFTALGGLLGLRGGGPRNKPEPERMELLAT